MSDLHGFDDYGKFGDFSAWTLRPDITLDGLTKKIPVEDDSGDLYLLKFQKEKAGLVIPEHSLEFISCKLAKALGYQVQEVKLGYYNGLPCTAIKMFSEIPITFGGLGSSTLDGVEQAYDLSFLLDLAKNKKLGISQEEYIQWVWKVFVFDMLIGNVDRHENNWGFFKIDNKYYPSPLFDLGSSFYPKLGDDIISAMSDGELRNLITHSTRSSILVDGKKKNYFDMLEMNKENTYLIDEIKQLIDRFAIDELTAILNHVNQFDQDFQVRSVFIDRVVQMRLKLLRGVTDGIHDR